MANLNFVKKQMLIPFWVIVWVASTLSVRGENFERWNSLDREMISGDEVRASLSQQDEIGRLIDLLASPQFRVRESSMKQLIDCGAPAVPILAQRAASASPEVLRRIKICLEKIGVRCDEANFLKSMAINQLLFDMSTTEVMQFEKQWREVHSGRTIEKLVKLGARVDVVRKQEGMLDNLVLISPSLRARKKSFKKKVVRREFIRPKGNGLKQEIDQILLASTPENRERLKLKSRQPEDRFGVNEIDETRALLKVMRIQQGLGGLEEFKMPGVKVTLGKEWLGDSVALNQLRHIVDLRTVRFESVTLEPDVIKAVAENTVLRVLEFKNCRFSKGMAEQKLPLANRMAFYQSKIDSQLLKKIKETRVRELAFDRCVFTRDALAGVWELRGLKILELKGLNLTRTEFEGLAKPSDLSLLQLSGSKFSIEDYQYLLRERPGLRVSLVSGAFLGVQSDLGVEPEVGCIISSVVSNSAADEAGIQVNDRITKLDGTQIGRFEDLKLKISQYLPSETVQLEVERKGKKLKLKATLRDIDKAPRF